MKCAANSIAEHNHDPVENFLDPNWKIPRDFAKISELMNKTQPRIRVLIIDEEGRDAELLRRCLEGLDLGSLEISALRKISQVEEFLKKNPLELILLSLPGSQESLFQLASRCKEIQSQTPLLVVAVGDNQDFAMKLGKLGVSDFIVKDDLFFSSVGRSVRRLLHGKTSKDATTIPAEKKSSPERVDESYWIFPSNRVKTPTDALLNTAREKYCSLLSRAQEGVEAQTAAAIDEFAEFAFQSKIPEKNLIRIHREWIQTGSFRLDDSSEQFLLLELLATLLEKYRPQ